MAGVPDRVLRLAARPSPARPRGAADPYTGINHTSSGLANFSESGLTVAYNVWSSFVDEECAAAFGADPSPCLLSNNSFPYVASEAYAMEMQTDEVVLTAHDWLPAQWRDQPPERAYMAQWAANMSIALGPLMDAANARNGAFSPACFLHTSFYPTGPLIKGLNFITAFSNWYFNKTGPEGYKLADDCGLECNPTCPPS